MRGALLITGAMIAEAIQGEPLRLPWILAVCGVMFIFGVMDIAELSYKIRIAKSMEKGE